LELKILRDQYVKSFNTGHGFRISEFQVCWVRGSYRGEDVQSSQILLTFLWLLLASFWMLRLSYYSTLKMEVLCIFETYANSNRTTRYHIAEDMRPHFTAYLATRAVQLKNDGTQFNDELAATRKETAMK
jgi:hypothetical protein